MDSGFIEREWSGFSNTPGQVNTMLVLDRAGQPIAAYRDGAALVGFPLAHATALAARIAARLPGSGQAETSALVATADGATFVGAANIVPFEGERTSALMALPVRRLVFMHPVNTRLLAFVNETIKVTGLHVGPAGGGAEHLTVPVDGGATLTLVWQPRGLGARAVERSLAYLVPGLVLGTMLIAAAMRANLASMRALDVLANRDRLTGLPNRGAFLAELERRLARGGPVALGMLDLTGFKAVNDTHGHLAGDDLLRAVAIELAASASPGDLVARLGGDEFAFFAPGLDAAERMAARLARTPRTPAGRRTVDAHNRNRRRHRACPARDEHAGPDCARRRAALPGQARGAR